MRALAAFALGLCLVAMDCDEATGPGAELRDQLEAARERWAAQGYDEYALELQRDCFCGETHRGPVIVRVRFHEIVERVYQASGQPVPPDVAAFFPDVEGLFAFLEDALDRDPAQARAEFHPVYGYPTTIWIDYQANVADEEQGFTTISVSPLPAD